MKVKHARLGHCIRATGPNIAVALLVVCYLSPPAFGAITTAEVIEKAKARQAKVKSLDVKLQHNEDQAPGAISWLFDGLPGTSGKKIPATRTKISSTNRLAIEGNGFRYENNHPIWHSVAGSLHQRSQIQVANGTVAKTHFPKGLAGNGGSEGVILQHGWHDMANLANFAPLMFAFRGLDANLTGHDWRLLKSGDVSLPIGGVSCTRFNLGNTVNMFSFWIDDSGLVRRIQLTTKGTLVNQCDIRYENRFGVTEFPISWTDGRYAQNGSLMIENKVEVLDATVNSKLAKDEFEVQFPAGTEVYNQKDKKEYIAQQDGSLREKARPGGPQGGPPQEFLSRNGGWIGIGVAILIVLLLTGFLVRRRLQKQ